MLRRRGDRWGALIVEGALMIPTMMVFGLVFGRWWHLALLASAVLWPAILVADGVMGLSADLLSGALLGVVNAAVGVLVHQGLLWLVRRLRGSHAGSAHRARS